MASKQYASPEAYEAKLEKVMARLCVEIVFSVEDLFGGV